MIDVWFEWVNGMGPARILSSILLQFIYNLFIFSHMCRIKHSHSIINKINTNNGRTRVEHGDAFRDHRRSPIRDHDIFVASVPHGGRKSQHLHCRSRAHLHDCVRSRTAGSRQPSALSYKNDAIRK